MISRLTMILFLTSLLLTVFAEQPAAMIDQEEISAEEQRQAEEFGELFTRRLRETKDFNIIVNEFFADNFLDCYRESKDFYFKLMVSDLVRIKQDIIQNRETEMRRYVISWFNYSHASLPAFEHIRKGNNDLSNEEIIKGIPGLHSLLTSNPATAVFVKAGGDEDIRPAAIETVKELEDLCRILDRATEIMLDYLNKNQGPVMLGHFEPQPYLYKAERKFCNIKAGTKLIAIKIPVEAFIPPTDIMIDSSYVLVCARIKGKLRILYITYGDAH
jgi:hypothetical protein